MTIIEYLNRGNPIALFKEGNQRERITAVGLSGGYLTALASIGFSAYGTVGGSEIGIAAMAMGGLVAIPLGYFATSMANLNMQTRIQRERYAHD